MNIIIRCNIAGKLKITDLASHVLSILSPHLQTLILTPIEVTMLLLMKKLLSMSPVSVPPFAPALHLLIVLAPKVKTLENNFKKNNYAHSWNAKEYVGEAKNAVIGMALVNQCRSIVVQSLE